MTTLAEFGVSEARFKPYEEILEEENPVCIIIKACDTWDEVKDILEQNRKTHPGDKVWIGRQNDKFLVGREKE